MPNVTSFLNDPSLAQPIAQSNDNKQSLLDDQKIYDYCQNEVTFENILKYIFDHYSLSMNANQYVLVGSTIRSYLSYLSDENKIMYEFKNNKMFWKQIA